MATHHHQEIGHDDTSILPNDIVLDILLRLPKFKSVCKSWNTTITNTHFIQTHLQKHNNLFLHISSNPSDNHKQYVYSIVTLQRLGLTNRFRSESTLEFPVGCETVLCTCQGVALITDRSYDKYMLWNHLTRQHATFMYPYGSDGRRPVYHGLCYDPRIKDFKAVVACEKYYAVYSCKNMSWTGRRDFGYRFCAWGTSTGIFVDGVIYWLVSTKHRKLKEIIYFDPRTDGFKTLKKPEHMKGLLKYKNYYLACLRGSLCLYFRTTDKKTSYQIWIKEKGRDNNGWSELMMVENFEKPRGMHRIRPVYLFEDNKILIQINGRRFVIYSPFEKTFEKIEDIDPLLGFQLVPCPESLLWTLEDLSPRKRKRQRSEDIMD